MDQSEQLTREHLVDYLAGHVSLDAFTSWLIGATWNVGNSASAGGADLAYAVELALAEHSERLLTDEELRAELLTLRQHGKQAVSRKGSRVA